jgi:pimeloyl-ACP methyl ester carboxylesterase
MNAHEKLGTARHVTLPQGELRYFERGRGRPVVFVHGVLTNALLWRNVVPTVADAGFRCLAPDLPLGAHPVPMRSDADLSAAGLATLLGDFLTALDLEDVILVANDTGGAITQLLLARYPERVGRVVLTPSDSFEYFFPPIFKPLPPIARVPGSMAVLGQLLRIKALYRLPLLFGVQRDVRKFLRTVDSSHTLAAAEKLRQFKRPVLLVWPPEEKLFPISLAHRLAEVLPDAELVEVADSYTFVSEDQPDALAGHITRFAAAMAD